MEKIKNSHDQWNANLYDSKHSFVSDFGADVLDLLAPQKGEHILDLGCGTGDLANKLYERGVKVVGVDKSENMIKQAQDKYPNIEFLTYDALNLPYKNTFDAVFSNAVLHWIKQPKAALENIYRCLLAGGRFVAEFGGKGNVQMITEEVKNVFDELGLTYNEEQFPWFFPSIGEYTSLMEEAGFHVTYAYHFERPTKLDGADGLKNWLKMFGNSMFTGLDDDATTNVIENVENNLKNSMLIGGNWIADYKRLRVIGLKK